jgi:signal transduction histidine kinase
VSWKADGDADCISTDRRKLEHVLSCLLSNAAKFTEVGRIVVTVRRRAKDLVAIDVSDTGIGIASSDLAIIFEDFRQVDGSVTRRYGGLGVGLALVNSIVELLGGKLELESELGVGTTARVILPRQAPTGRAALDEEEVENDELDWDLARPGGLRKAV